jgi:hypothetical protein
MTERTQKILETFLREPKFSKRNEISALTNVLREIVSDYEVQKQERLKWEREWMEAQTKQGRWTKK